MTEQLREDLLRFRSLHSWYKYPKKCLMNVYPFLMFGQQPYQPIFPDTDPLYDSQLCWWFLFHPDLSEFQSIFKTDAQSIWNASQECVCNIEIYSLGSLHDEKIMEELTKNALKFQELTKHIYENMQAQKH